MLYKVQILLILKLAIGTSFTCAKAIRALVYTDLLLMIRCYSLEQRTHPIWLLAAKIFTPSL